MNILFITHYASNYGANKSMLELINYLKGTYGVNASVLLPWEGELTKELKTFNIPYHIVKFYPWRKNTPDVKDITRNLYNKYIASRKIVDVCDQEFDIIHTNSSVTDIGQYVADIMRKPHIWHIREFGLYDYDLKYTMPTLFVNKVIKRATKLICVSRSVQDYYSTMVCKSGNYKVIYNGVSLPENICKYEINNDILEFCCIGLITEGKRQLDIVMALHKLVKQGYRNIILNLVGKAQKKYNDRIAKYIEDNQLEKYIVMWGHQDDVCKILSKMDVGIMSSQREAFGRVTIEYMLAHMPVIGTNSGGTAEIIENGKSGWLYEAGDIDALAELMQKYICNRKLIAEHGNYAYENIVPKFTVENNAINIIEVYKEVLDFR